LRGATSGEMFFASVICYFNPRTSCEVRRTLLLCLHRLTFYFNPRTSCEVRHSADAFLRGKYEFQSTHLLRGATLCSGNWNKVKKHFNPRTSCEARLNPFCLVTVWLAFQSTHLLRGATCTFERFCAIKKYFNPRTSCEVRQTARRLPTSIINFNPRTSCEVRQVTPDIILPLFRISIHAPLARCDCWPDPSSQTPCNFNPRTSCEVRHSV